jgi:hypothetical protein
VPACAQGENNVGECAYYECAFPLMIEAWRKELQVPEAPFYFVQVRCIVQRVVGVCLRRLVS